MQLKGDRLLGQKPPPLGMTSRSSREKAADRANRQFPAVLDNFITQTIQSRSYLSLHIISLYIIRIYNIYIYIYIYIYLSIYCMYTYIYICISVRMRVHVCVRICRTVGRSSDRFLSRGICGLYRQQDLAFRIFHVMLHHTFQSSFGRPPSVFLDATSVLSARRTVRA